MKFNSYRVKYRIDNGMKCSVTVTALNEIQAKENAVKEINGCYGTELCKTLEIIEAFKLPNIR